jgi:hypothetical protein
MAGDTLSLEFVPHVYTDVSWTGTGYSNDTPYGDWIASAGPPAGSPHSCLPKDRATENIYAPLSVAPPQKSITGASGLGCEALTSDGKMTCSPTNKGTFSPVFTFAPTTGRFYGRMQTGGYPNAIKNFGGDGIFCVGSNAPMETYAVGGTDCEEKIDSTQDFGRCQFARPSGSAYTLTVPQQTISCPITVIPSPEDDPTTPEDESDPTTPTQPSLAASGGAACVAGQSHSISMTSTDPEGDNIRYLVDWNADGTVDEFVPGAGYVPSGTTLSASRTYATGGNKTVRVRAQDENGNLSPWATLSFVCADSSQAGISGDGTNPPPGTGTGSGTLPPAPDLQLRAIPSLVRSGTATRVSWSATNVESCTVAGTNGDSWTGAASPIGGQQSSPILGETVYTLTCLALDGATQNKQATVRVIPTWRER